MSNEEFWKWLEEVWRKKHNYEPTALQGWQAGTAHRDAEWVMSLSLQSQAAISWGGDNVEQFINATLDHVRRAATDAMKAERSALRILVQQADRGYCMVCGFVLAKHPSEGCVPGNCSYRPEEDSAEYQRVAGKRKTLEAALQEHTGRRELGVPWKP